MKPKIIAFYLPQFHRVPENDKWWGEGYTEWTAVKAAESLYEGHNQPRIPMDNNYYNLLEHGTMAWQAELMRTYGIDGMCFYHYWFEKGRRILEKPAENLLQWSDVPMPFCFCWANETWARTWAKIENATSWVSGEGMQSKSDGNGILLKQCYGREEDWEEHFQYLLPFFRDDRYIKIDEKPVFLIYKPQMIFSLWSMMQYFKRRAKECGLSGIYVIGMDERKFMGTDAVLIRQPYHALGDVITKDEITELPVRCSYDRVWEEILKKKIYEERTYLCGFVDYDDTPRRGKKGIIIEAASPEKFYKTLKKIYEKSILLNNEFLFLNAWNEWGEGMYMEPDVACGYGYLEAVKRVITECRENPFNKNIEVEAFFATEEERILREKEERIQNLRRHDKLLDDWMYLRDCSVNVSQFFYKYGYQKIAIYGMGKLGKHLLHELRQGGISVIFGIDKNGGEGVKKIGLEIYRPNQKLPDVDAVVITVTDQYAKISSMLSEIMTCPMVTIEEIIQETVMEQ